MDDKYIFTYVDEDREGIFRDYTSENGKKVIDFLASHKRFKNPLLNKAEKICLSYRLNSKFHVPFQTVFYNLETYNYEQKYTYHMLMPTTSISKFTVKYLNNFKRRHCNVKLYALVTDSMHASSPHMNLVRGKLFADVWEQVLTYDKWDAEEYGFIWFGYMIHSDYDYVLPDLYESDIYYVGFNKGEREGQVLGLYDYFLRNGINARFDVVSKNKESGTNLKYIKKKISYPEVVARAKSSNCILEILQKGQKSSSQRYAEAVAYNRKFLTMNENIIEYPFYNPKYMKVFKNPSDIDIDWVKTKENVEYGYNHEFSPLNLIDIIRKL